MRCASTSYRPRRTPLSSLVLLIRRWNSLGCAVTCFSSVCRIPLFSPCWHAIRMRFITWFLRKYRNHDKITIPADFIGIIILIPVLSLNHTRVENMVPGAWEHGAQEHRASCSHYNTQKFIELSKHAEHMHDRHEARVYATKWWFTMNYQRRVSYSNTSPLSFFLAVLQRGLRKVQSMSQTRIVRSLVESRLTLHTRRLATQPVSALRQEGPSLKHRPKKTQSTMTAEPQMFTQKFKPSSLLSRKCRKWTKSA